MFHVSPLVSSAPSRRPFADIQVADLVTINIYNPDSGLFDTPAGARVRRIGARQVWISIAGLVAPAPYMIGDNLVIDHEQVIDW